MVRRVPLALPLAVALLAACGGSNDSSGPPHVTCGSTATSSTLAVNAQPTCGSLLETGFQRYYFTASVTGTYAVTLWTTSGDVDLFVNVNGVNYHSEKTPPEWVDGVTFPVNLAPSGPQVTVSAPFSNSTYAIQVTGP